ncbi:helix-turn-helix transcriptional regulator [Actinospica durhamensis]|uniref:Helix-turn-helix transcriptional regulator n=1 Tax=Actinospica durhamensis TaxID=1508375 RepID=A0A941ET55_9ACTN|nr:winged helix-turn-helix domain-containing protein [Actinospica durhamensis]MBR7833374.1 helix-turn-helix transcriptional regulator [Actinospica durhamensis]
MSTDPQALRALAHPLRWTLMDVLEREGSATATRCAELTGESVASCAYHLGILAKYGYVEASPDRSGREKPWQLTGQEQRIGGDDLDLDGELAAEAAVEAFLEHEFGRIRQRARQRSRLTPEWREASCVLGSSMWLTAEEMREIKTQLTEIAYRYAARDADASLRPEGAQHVRLFSATTVAVPPSGEGAI